MKLKNQTLNTDTLKSVSAAVFYVGISVLMTFFNKAVLSYYRFKYANVILLIQLIATVLILRLLKFLKLITMENFNFEKAKKLYIVSLFYSFNAGIALVALSNLNIPVYGSLKRLTLVTVMIGEWILLKKKSSLRIIFSICLIILGAVIMGIGDIEFNMVAYLMATASCLSQTCYLLFLAKTKLDSGLNTFEMLFYNCLLSIPILFALVVVTGELQSAFSYSHLYEVQFLVCLGGAVLLGSILNYAIFICTIVNSPLTLVVTGQLKTVLSTFFGLFAFGGIELSFLNLLGLCVNTAGGVLYAWFKYLEQQKKEHSDKENP